jgi:DNA (cytosine-5)-methyltransferase 1
MTTIKAVDLFCGAGGTSTGAMAACDSLGYRMDLLAVNHWGPAITTHRSNHVSARHICDNLNNVRPGKAIAGYLDLLMASPECTHHSIARGSAPILDQKRVPAWLVVKWIRETAPRMVLVENVKEFVSWGPVDENGQRMKERAGETFLAWVAKIKNQGYSIDWRVLNCADYGDPTVRHRLFIMARHDGLPIEWPAPTHASEPTPVQQPWIPARDIIDWSIKGQSIFTRRKPLADNTLRRIEEGIKKFWGPVADPFLVILRGTSARQLSCTAKQLELPLPTLTAGGGHFGLVQPVGRPLSTIATRGADALVEPLLIEYYGNGMAKPISQPIPTLTTHDRLGLLQRYGMDILYRMLQPSELAAAMGFPRGYLFAGKQADIVKQIGNAVPVNTAQALVRCLLRSVMEVAA